MVLSDGETTPLYARRRRHVGHTDETEPPWARRTFGSSPVPLPQGPMLPSPRWLALVASALIGACGGPQPHTASDLPRGAVALASTEADPLPAPALLDPYAPTRTSPTEYTWRRAARDGCGARTPFRFEGSHGEFPLLPEGPEVAEAPDTWGTGSAPRAAALRVPKSADQVVAELRPRLRRCFSAWLERGSANEASVRFTVQLACGGEVGALSAKSSGVDEPTVACLFGVVAQASFESPPTGQATLQIPVVFKNTER